MQGSSEHHSCSSQTGRLDVVHSVKSTLIVWVSEGTLVLCQHHPRERGLDPKKGGEGGGGDAGVACSCRLHIYLHRHGTVNHICNSYLGKVYAQTHKQASLAQETKRPECPLAIITGAG